MNNHPWQDADKLIEFAENSTTPPEDPAEGIPKQIVPGWIRWPIRVLFLPFVVFDLWIQKWVSKFFKTPYKSEGGCNKRGNCCYFILIPAPTTFFTKLYYFWHTQINGFYPRQKQTLPVDKEHLVILGCRYLSKEGKCNHHRLRPSICRQWPQIEYFGRPKILKGCGYRAVPRDKNFDPFPWGEKDSQNKLNILK